MAEELVRAIAETAPTAVWLCAAALGLVALCLIYLGIALVAVLRTDITNTKQQEYRYQVFRELVDLIRDICRCRGKP